MQLFVLALGLYGILACAQQASGGAGAEAPSFQPSSAGVWESFLPNAGFQVYGDGFDGVIGDTRLAVRFVDAERRDEATPLERTPRKSHYFLGSDPARWRTNVPHFRRVRYERIYPAVDVEYYFRASELEYDFRVAPGGDTSSIRLTFPLANRVSIGSDGYLSSWAGGKGVRQRPPYAYQVVDGRKVEVPVSYVLGPGVSPEVGFRVGEHRSDLELVIDPVVELSQRIGGSGQDLLTDVAVDRFDNIYLSGWTNSAPFPGESSATERGSLDMVVMKMDPTATQILWTAVIGGGGDDRANGIAVDASGSAYVAGSCSSNDFPTTPDAVSRTNSGSSDLCLIVLD